MPDTLLAIISDTHMPRGGRRLPARCVAWLQAADVILHAGDLSAVSVLRELEAHGPVAAVHGNVDSPEVVRLLPSTRVVDVGRWRIALIHDAGPANGRLAQLRRSFPGVDAVVFGHSHMPLHERDGDFQIFNPGSPTERRRAPHPTMGIARAGGDELAFELIELD